MDPRIIGDGAILLGGTILVVDSLLRRAALAKSHVPLLMGLMFVAFGLNRFAAASAGPAAEVLIWASGLFTGCSLAVIIFFVRRGPIRRGST